MRWYAAHVIMSAKFLEGVQTIFPVWENIVLIPADSTEEAWAKAEKKGAQEADSCPFTYSGRNAIWEFAGVRRLMECTQDLDDLEDREEGGPQEFGTEITFSSFVLESVEDLTKLVANQNVKVTYEEKHGSHGEQFIAQDNSQPD